MFPPDIPFEVLPDSREFAITGIFQLGFLENLGFLGKFNWTFLLP
jgi:hypothetical protein